MNSRLWALAAVAVLAGGAWAQQPASSFFTGVPATQVRNVPLDTSRALIQHPAQSAQTATRFNFTALFSKFTMPSWPPKKGISPLPAPSSFASTKYPNFRTVGTPPYPINYMFGNGKSPIAPVAPVIPNNRPPVGPGS